jgi:ArsR family transcriptional regulator, arsenate/arsenite/antimonite-responsive transcriptional repressor
MTTTNAAEAARILELFQAIAEPTRLDIVRRLTAGERCVCDLQGDLDAAQSRLSFHLRKLRDAGVISDRKDGRWVYYSLVPEALEQMRAFLGEVKDECCAWNSSAGQLVPLSAARGDGCC